MENLHKTDPGTYPNIPGESSTWIAIACFAIGTLLFLGYQLFPQNELFIFGFLFVAVALLVNLAVVLQLFLIFCLRPKLREYLAIKILIVLANIPIACGYFFYTINH